MSVEVIVLAAGQGTRMRSGRPKALHELAGEPLLSHVLRAGRATNPAGVSVVVGSGAELVKTHFAQQGDIRWVNQEQRLGTGHAVQIALAGISDGGIALILYGDVPLIGADTLNRCVEMARDASGITVVTADVANPHGFGRIVRETDGRIVAVVEERDASDAERAITEINSGILAAPVHLMRDLVDGLSADNAQGEYYLTDIIGAAERQSVRVSGLKVDSPEEVAGVNDRIQLAELEAHHRRRQAERLMLAGVTLMDPTRIDVRGSLQAGEDCVIDVNVVFVGDVTLGNGVYVGPGCYVKNCTLGDNVTLHPHTVMEGAVVGAGAEAGPFARLRPGAELGEGAKIGNFVEMKKALLGPGSKASHLAYLGDASIGAGCNIGAGTITCNYDGVDKHRTEIGDNVFIGTNATLVAPIVIEDEAYVGAGSTITARVGKADLAIGRAKQRNIQGWTPPGKRNK